MRFSRALALGAFAGIVLMWGSAGSPTYAADGPTQFASTEEAAKALIAALEKNDDAALRALVGPGNEDIVQSGGDATVAADRRKFLDAAKQELDFDTLDDGRVVIVVGVSEWPLPIPLVPKDGKWTFDAASARDEILARRIGANELDAIQICRDYAEAQVAYASRDHDGDKVREYAQKILSTPGQRDGLYWETKEGEEPSPFADSALPVEEATKTEPFNGYFWKVLTAQGANAPGGAHSFVINGNMIAGFALVGTPAKHRNTGVMTFLVSHHGTIYEKDLGPGGLEAVKALTAFDPDASWKEYKGEPEDAGPVAADGGK
jgi:hypothetical protein